MIYVIVLISVDSLFTLMKISRHEFFFFGGGGVGDFVVCDLFIKLGHLIFVICIYVVVFYPPFYLLTKNACIGQAVQLSPQIVGFLKVVSQRRLLCQTKLIC